MGEQSKMQGSSAGAGSHGMLNAEPLGKASLKLGDTRPLRQDAGFQDGQNRRFFFVADERLGDRYIPTGCYHLFELSDYT